MEGSRFQVGDLVHISDVSSPYYAETRTHPGNPDNKTCTLAWLQSTQPRNGKVQSFSDRFGRSDAPLIKRRNAPKGEIMLWTIFVILLILWLLGLVSSYTLGGFIHILLVIALVVLVIELVGRRRVL
jgi:hypothetical protein